MGSVHNSSDNIIEEEDLFDYNYLFQIILRNKLKIFFITFITVLISIIYAFTAKKVWLGQFQIVISQNSSNTFEDVQDSLRQASPGLAKLVGMSSTTSKPLQTEVEILKSPSVLMPVFNYVKKQSKKNNLMFEIWMRKKLDIDIKKGTSVLNVSYKDKNK